MPTLKRIPDGAGDSGSMSIAIRWNLDSTFKAEEGYRPKVGCSMLVGSNTARTMQTQDYWLTTEVTEILEDTPEYVKFKTKNSIYEWRK